MNIPPEWVPTVEAMGFLAAVGIVLAFINEFQIRRRAKKSHPSPGA
jgi:hypothetical protein